MNVETVSTVAYIYLLVALWVILPILLATALSLKAKRVGKSAWLWFMLSLLLSPLVAWIAFKLIERQDRRRLASIEGDVSV